MDTSTKLQYQDRRVTRTKNFLRNAILDLVVERGEFNTIQINDIADKADLARSTFYLHYSDKEELLYDALDYEFHKFFNEIQEYHQKEYASIHLLSILKYVCDNPRYFQVVLNSVGTTKAFEQTRKTLGELLLSWVDFSIFDSSVPHDLIIYHISGTIINSIKWWLETGNEYSPEEMNNFIFDLIFNGTLKAIGLNTKDELDNIFIQQILEREQGRKNTDVTPEN